jgi:hypothetical protein
MRSVLYALGIAAVFIISTAVYIIGFLDLWGLLFQWVVTK